jgi:addiction module HigA family antidote
MVAGADGTSGLGHRAIVDKDGGEGYRGGAGAELATMMAVHPGRVLRREMAARELSANALALALRTPSGRITDILNGKRGVSPETAMRLARYFGNSARFWLNLQTTYELALAERELGEKIAAEVSPAA